VNHYTVLLALMVLNIVASAETFAAIPAAAIAMPAANPPPPRASSLGCSGSSP